MSQKEQRDGWVRHFPQSLEKVARLVDPFGSVRAAVLGVADGAAQQVKVAIELTGKLRREEGVEVRGLPCAWHQKALIPAHGDFDPQRRGRGLELNEGIADCLGVTSQDAVVKVSEDKFEAVLRVV